MDGRKRIAQASPSTQAIPDGICTTRPGTLTKTFLFALPDGSFVVSEWFHHWRSIFAEELGPGKPREAIWARAKEAGAAGKQCQILSTYEEFNRAKLHLPTLQAGLQNSI